ncbi:MAG: hypothetical protein QM762_13905 [Chryseolinea sp.]
MKEVIIPGTFGQETTITLTAGGQTIETIGNFIHERSTYDSMLFLVSMYEGPDVYQTTLLDYSYDRSGNLIQSWKTYSGDTIVSPAEVTFFKKVTLIVDEKTGNVTEEIDSTGNQRVRNEYNTNGLLVKKSILESSTKVVKSIWYYDYKSEELERIRWEAPDGKQLLVHYFSNGLPDSTKDVVKDFVVKYQYKFN